MAILKNAKNYKSMFNNYNINLAETTKYLKTVKIFETLNKILIFMYLSLFSFVAYAMITAKKSSNSSGELTIMLIMLLVTFVVVVFIIAFSKGKQEGISKLDDLFFNEFLIKNVQIFYSIEELKDFEFSKDKHIHVKVFNQINANQAIIELVNKAFLENAEGILITNKSTAGVTSGSINKKGGDIKTNIVNTAEGVLINNIKRKNTQDKNDIEYWFNLLQKGAITQEEYETKKKELM